MSNINLKDFKENIEWYLTDFELFINIIGNSTKKVHAKIQKIWRLFGKNAINKYIIFGKENNDHEIYYKVKIEKKFIALIKNYDSSSESVTIFKFELFNRVRIYYFDKIQFIHDECNAVINTKTKICPNCKKYLILNQLKSIIGTMAAIFRK